MQEIGKLFQISYVVDDLEKAARNWVELTGDGPMFIGEHFPIIDPRYRGQPTDVDLSLGLGFSDGICVEYVYQHNDVPSVYKELGGKKPIDFHHWAFMTEDFGASIDAWKKKGCEVCFEGDVEAGARFVYMDAVSKLGGMVELMEVNQKVLDLFGFLENAARDWDGTDPVRYL